MTRIGSGRPKRLVRGRRPTLLSKAELLSWPRLAEGERKFSGHFLDMTNVFPPRRLYLLRRFFALQFFFAAGKVSPMRWKTAKGMENLFIRVFPSRRLKKCVKRDGNVSPVCCPRQWGDKDAVGTSPTCSLCSREMPQKNTHNFTVPVQTRRSEMCI